MERREYLAIATAALLAGCRSDDESTPTSTSINGTTERPTTSESPVRTATSTETPTPTETATETRTERPPSEQSERQLDEARTRLNTAVERFIGESHVFRSSSMLETNADSREFTPSRVTGAIEDARKSLRRADDRANASQQTAIEELRGFADWLEGAVAVQTRIVRAATTCRLALASSVPHDEQTIREAFGRLSTQADDVRSVMESHPGYFGDVSDDLETIESGDVSAKTQQLEAESDTIETFAGYGESLIEGMDLLRESRTENYDTAIQLAEDAMAEFQTVEDQADDLVVPGSLSDERAAFEEHADDWVDHAEDRIETYKDERDS